MKKKCCFKKIGRILYLIKPKCGDQFIYFLCQIVSNMMHKSSENQLSQFGLIEKIMHQSYCKLYPEGI